MMTLTNRPAYAHLRRRCGPPSIIIPWREGTNALLFSRFARLRVGVAHAGRICQEEWGLIERPKGEAVLFKRVDMGSLPRNVSDLRYAINSAVRKTQDWVVVKGIWHALCVNISESAP